MKRKTLLIPALLAAPLLAAGAALAGDFDLKIPLPPIPKIKIPAPPIPRIRIEAPSPSPAKIRPAPHRYNYYPDAEVYFDPSRQIYFFFRANKWLAQAVLPPDIEVRIGNAVTVDLDSERPYEFHDDVRRVYPRTRERHRYGYREGFDNGYEQGYQNGYDNAYRDAYREGYREGYRNADRDRRPPPRDHDRGRKEGWDRDR